MTYKKLADIILCNPEQWDKDVTVYIDDVDEYYQIHCFDYTVDSDVIDDNHLILVIN